MSVAQTGRKHSAATKKKIGEGNKGKIVSEESKRRMSIAQTGHITSEEQKQKLVLSSPRRKTIRCIETGEIFNSYRDAERKTGIKHQTISDCINGKQKTTGGYHWEVVRGDE